MQYIHLALSLAWPEMLVSILWLITGIAALWYARATRRPIFLFGGIVALLLAGSEVLSPARLALRYFTHRVSCASADACTTELLYGAAKYEWLIGGIAAVVLLIGLYLEVSRARRRAAVNNAARAAATKAAMAAPPAEEAVPAGAFAGQYQAASAAQPITSYGAAIPDDFDPAVSGGLADPALTSDLAPPAEDERPTFYRRPATGSGPF